MIKIRFEFSPFNVCDELFTFLCENQFNYLSEKKIENEHTNARARAHTHTCTRYTADEVEMDCSDMFAVYMGICGYFVMQPVTATTHFPKLDRSFATHFLSFQLHLARWFIQSEWNGQVFHKSFLLSHQFIVVKVDSKVRTVVFVSN